MIYGIAALFIFQLLGELLVHWLHLPVPGPLIGMLLLFVALLGRGGLPDGLRDTAAQLLRHLMLLFIPAVTGVMMYFERVRQEWLPFIVAGIAGAAFTMIVTALTLRWMIKLTGKDAR